MHCFRSAAPSIKLKRFKLIRIVFTTDSITYSETGFTAFWKARLV